MKKANTFTLIIPGKESKEFETFDELYAYFDYEVSVYDIDNCKVKVNGHLLNGGVTHVANTGTWKNFIR